MSLRAIPLIVIAFIIYNVVVLFSGNVPADEILNKQLFQFRMVSGADWVFRTSDLLILLTMILLFVELIKSAYVSASQMVDPGLSMLVFIACLIEFLLQPKATTSVFFFIMTAALVDVVAGAIISIQAARRNVNIGSDS